MPHLRLSILLLFFVLLSGTATAAAETAAPAETRGCFAANIIINEIDYDQPGLDNEEFVELYAEGPVSLTGLQLRLLDRDGSTYRSISLSGYSVGTIGFFVIGSANISAPPDLLVAADDFIRNETGGVGLYNVASGSYCSFINYEGTVDSMGAWLNIGADYESDGDDRGCSRRAIGWWSCSRPVTPGGGNSTVAVQLQSQSTAAGSVIPAVVALLLLTIASFTVRRRAVHVRL